jgi:phosphatidate cytidylyltransferase
MRFDPAGYLASIPAPLFWGLAGVLGLLTLGAAASLAAPVLRPGQDHTNLRQRVTSWWVMAALLGGGLLAGWQATLALFAFISFLGLREFLSLAPMRREDRLIILLAHLTIVANYAFL